MGAKGSKAKAQQQELPDALKEKLMTMFTKMDADGNGTIDKEEAVKFWGKNWAKARAALPPILAPPDTLTRCHL